MWDSRPRLFVERSSTFFFPGFDNAGTKAYSTHLVLYQLVLNLLVLDQPVHRFLPRFERRKVALRKILLLTQRSQTLSDNHGLILRIIGTIPTFNRELSWGSGSITQASIES